MTRLTQDTLSRAKAQLPAYDRKDLGIGIVHFGPGAFHRAHQAYYTDEAIALGGGNWGICGVSLNSRTASDALSPQDGLYTLAVKDINPSYRIIGCLKEVLCAKDDPALVLARLTAPTTHIVTLTITEKGYALNPNGQLDVSNAGIAHDLSNPRAPVSAIAYLVEACRQRRDNGTGALTLISCDNLPENGEKLQTACLEFAKKIDADLAKYIDENVVFPCTMVDSITPASDTALLDQVIAQTGLSDKAAIHREQFTQWVIEDNIRGARPAWDRAGVIFTSDIKAFETTKLRILNGAHITLTYLGLLAGIDSVEAAIKHPKLSAFAQRLMTQETIPTIHPPAGLDLLGYWAATKARFENPNIRHLLEQISHDGSQKIPARIFPVIEHYLEQNSASPLACFVVSAWIEFNRQRRLAQDAPKDGYLTQIDHALPDPNMPPADYAKAFMALDGLFPPKIISTTDCLNTIVQDCEVIARKGVLSALTAYIPDQDGAAR